MSISQTIILFKRLIIVLATYSLCRLFFLLFNPDLLALAGTLKFTQIFISGIRFDIFSVLITNALFVLLHMVPGKWFLRKNYQRLLKFVYYGFNIPALLINCIDFIYYRFTQKRTTADLFTQEMAGDIKNNLFNYVTEFWYVILVILIIVFGMEFCYRKINIPNKENNSRVLLKSILSAASIVILFIIGVRGGLQFKPITMQTAARYAPPQLIPLVLNTPFTIIKTRDMQGLTVAKYMTDNEAHALIALDHHSSRLLTMRKLNVVIIILESFSKEYIGFFNQNKGFTPFLDSLCRKSLVFTNAFANGKRSIEGIPAITASIPPLMNEPFITSVYNTNSVNGIAGLLRLKGYNTAFYHGGNNGTMGLENFSLLAGYAKYFGRNEYPGPTNDYDGSWGIYDEPFFTFFKNQLDQTHQPFCATLFSLSSHHPYSIPAKYKNKFPKGNQAIFESLRYADFSLATFFKSASQSTWFSNTLFVITADHTGPAAQSYYQTSKGIYEIPIIYYCPSDTTFIGTSAMITQHCDILPSVLDYLNYDETFSAFGNSVFNNSDHFAVNYTNNLYQFFDNEFMLQFDGENTVGLYQYQKDSFLLNNIVGKLPKEEHQLEQKIKALLQQYNHAMIQNTMVKR